MANILIVEDEKAMQDIIVDYMIKGGHTCFTAGDGIDALVMLKNHPMDLIILDVMMPDMDGFELLREIRQTSEIPVLMLTAKGEAEDRCRGLELGADDYLVKPFLPKELLLRVNAILKRAYPDSNRTVILAASTVDLDRAEVRRDEGIFPLTGKE